MYILIGVILVVMVLFNRAKAESYRAQQRAEERERKIQHYETIEKQNRLIIGLLLELKDVKRFDSIARLKAEQEIEQ